MTLDIENKEKSSKKPSIRVLSNYEIQITKKKGHYLDRKRKKKTQVNEKYRYCNRHHVNEIPFSAQD